MLWLLLTSRGDPWIPTNSSGAQVTKVELYPAYVSRADDVAVPHTVVRFLPGSSHPLRMLLSLVPTPAVSLGGRFPRPQYFIPEETMVAKGM